MIKKFNPRVHYKKRLNSSINFSFSKTSQNLTPAETGFFKHKNKYQNKETGQRFYTHEYY